MGSMQMSNGGGVPVARKISRQEFLKLGGAGLAGAVFLGAAGCGGGGGTGGPTEIVFSFFPDPSGSVQALIDQFNQENEGEIQVSLREMPADSGQHFDQLNTEFQSGEINIDVIGGDVIWPAQFAAQGFIADLSDRFSEGEQSEFLPATIETNTYQGRIYGVPWYTDAGMLYYRSDLLEEAGFSEPPRTWDELKDQARTVQQDSGTRYGFVFQGANYEGGVVNGLEYIWTSGGEVLRGDDEVVIDNSQTRQGLEIERSMIDDGIAPEGVSQYKEQEVGTIFLGGDAVFMRNVPRFFALADDPDESSISTEQVGVAALPVAEEGLQSYSALGGWNFFLNANSGNADAAYEFIRFMSAPEQQKYRAINATVLPSRQELYEDEELLAEVRIAELGQQAVQNTRPRPVSPFYSDMSLRMADQFNASLNGEVSPEEALTTLQEELEEIVQQGEQKGA